MARKILTTHVGSLPRPKNIIELNRKRADGEKIDEAEFDRELRTAVIDTVKKQKEVGVDLVNDGEFGHNMGWNYDYGSWWSYVVRRLDGVEVQSKPLWMQNLDAQTKHGLTPKDFMVGEWMDRRDWKIFEEAYMDPASGCALPEQFMTHYSPVVTGKIKYKGHDAIKRDIASLKAGTRSRRHQGRGLDELGCAGELLAHGERGLQERRGADGGLRRRDARGIQGDRRCRANPSAR